MSGKEERKAADWRLEDLVAFECALADDEREDWAALRARDAALDVDLGLWRSGNRRQMAKVWLDKRLEQQPEIKLAADSIGHSLSVSGQLLGVAGFLLGLGLATAALAYTGAAPINVSAFFSVFVLLQALTAVALLVAFVFPRRWREAWAFGPLFRFSRWILEAILSRTQALAGRFLSAQQRTRAAEIAGDARRTFTVHGAVAKWMAFTKIQAAALCFNAGALAALLVSVAFSDRAFGWQTTLDVSEDSILRLVEVVALPWSWWQGEGSGYPNLEQIQGSRIVLKEGIRELESQDLVAWWRFLAFGIATYGVLPRILFWFLGKWQRRAALRRYDFRNAAVERLMQRLRPNEASFAAERVEQGSSIGADVTEVGAFGEGGSNHAVRCLCSRELAEAFELEGLRDALGRRWKMPAGLVNVRTYSEGKMAEQTMDMKEDEQLAVVFESWMPPIKETERQVKALRRKVDARCLLRIVLLGIPSGAGNEVSLKPESQYAEAWHSFARRLGDPYIVLDNPVV